MSDVLSHLREQAYWCGEFGSRFTCLLLLKAAADFEAGGPTARLLQDWPGNPRGDAVALRLAGALHAAALTRRDPALADLYPGGAPSGAPEPTASMEPTWSMERVWPAARAFLARESDWVRDFLASPPQTNETGRAFALAAGFLHLAERLPQPFHMLELGASAGLNLNWDAFRYAHPPWACSDTGRGEGDGPLIPTHATGAPPAWRDIAVASRAACDQHPIDVRDPDARLRLRSYIWADQSERLARLEAAVALALREDVRVESADAALWLAQRLGEGGMPAGTTVVYHSVFLQYPPRETRQAIRETMEAAGARATAERALAWVRLEPDVVLGGKTPARYVLNVVYWTGEGRIEATLAEADPHGRTVDWLAAEAPA